MYRRLGSKHLFQKNGRLFFFTRMRPGQNDRKHPLLVLLSVLCKSLQRSLIFIALPFSAYALFGKAGAKVRRFLIPSKCFERKVCENTLFFAMFDKTRDKNGVFQGGRRGKGRKTRDCVSPAKWAIEKGKRGRKEQKPGFRRGKKGLPRVEKESEGRRNWDREEEKLGFRTKEKGRRNRAGGIRHNRPDIFSLLYI